jgi:hypothetical protein
MIVMAVTEHQSVELVRLDLQDFHIVEQRHRIIAKIHQDVAHLVTALGFCMHRESPLPNEGGARRSVGNLVRWGPFDGEAIKLFRGHIATHHDVCDDANAQTIDFWDRATQCLCSRRLPAPDHCADQC